MTSLTVRSNRKPQQTKPQNPNYPYRLLFGLLVCLSTAAGTSAEPLSARQLTAQELGALTQSRPIWCLRRSNDGKTCDGVVRLLSQPDGRVEFRHFAINANRDGAPARQVRISTFTVEKAGLCGSTAEALQGRRFSYPALDDLANAGAATLPPEANEEMPTGAEEAFTAHTLKLRNSTLQDRFCIQIQQVGSGHQHYVMVPVWAAGTSRENREARDVVPFEALTEDPGLRLARAGTGSH